MGEIKLNIEGMSCGHCVAAVENCLKTIPGVGEVSVNLESGMAVVTGNVEPAVLISAIQDEGYEASVSG